MERQVRDAFQVGWNTGSSALGWCAGLWRWKGFLTGCGKGCAVAALGVLGCTPATLPNSSFLRTQGAVPRPQGAGSGRDSGSRAGGWRAGTHPSMWEAHREREGREGRPRREAKQGVAPGALVMHYWKHLAWDVGACTGCTHMCAHAHGYGETHTYVFMGTCVPVHVPTPVYTRVHMCPPTHPWVHMCPYVCRHTHTGMEVCTHM